MYINSNKNKQLKFKNILSQGYFLLSSGGRGLDLIIEHYKEFHTSINILNIIKYLLRKK